MEEMGRYRISTKNGIDSISQCGKKRDDIADLTHELQTSIRPQFLMVFHDSMVYSKWTENLVTIFHP